MRKEVERLVAYLFGVVPVFEHRPLVEVVPDVVQVFDEFVGVLCRLELFLHLRKRGCFEYVDDEHTVVRCERPSALGDEVRVRNTVVVGSLNEGVDTVVDVFLDAVVDRTLAAGRACAVIIYAQSAAAVHEIDVIAHLVELHIELCRLAEGCLDAAYLGNLTADMEVYESQTVVHPLFVEDVECL